MLGGAGRQVSLSLSLSLARSLARSLALSSLSLRLSRRLSLPCLACFFSCDSSGSSEPRQQFWNDTQSFGPNEPRSRLTKKVWAAACGSWVSGWSQSGSRPRWKDGMTPQESWPSGEALIPPSSLIIDFAVPHVSEDFFAVGPWGYWLVSCLKT